MPWVGHAADDSRLSFPFVAMLQLTDRFSDPGTSLGGPRSSRRAAREARPAELVEEAPRKRQSDDNNLFSVLEDLLKAMSLMR